MRSDGLGKESPTKFKRIWKSLNHRIRSNMSWGEGIANAQAKLRERSETEITEKPLFVWFDREVRRIELR
jgi:hypothetical protein